MKAEDATVEQLRGVTEPAPASADDENRENHRKALAQVAADYHRDLVLFLMARVGSEDKAREIAQETYARVLAFDRPDTISFLAGYVWRTARNLATNVGIQRTTRGRLDKLWHAGVERHSPSPEAEVDRSQRLELIGKALEELRQERPRAYEAYILRVVEDYKVEEVARIMNIAPRNVVSYVAKAAQHCRNYLERAGARRRSNHGGE